MKTRIREHLKRHFSTYISATNFLYAISIAALTVLGVFSNMMSVPMLIGNAAVFGVMYAVGKFGNEQLEDLPRVDEFEKGYPYV